MPAQDRACTSVTVGVTGATWTLGGGAATRQEAVQFVDALFVSATLAAATTQSRTFDALSHGFTIPGDATIRGIEATARFATSLDPTTAGDITDNQVRVLKANNPVGSNKARGTNWTLAGELVTFGGPTDLWNTTWTPTEINATTFGFRLRPLYTGGLTNAAIIDYMHLKVYYSVPNSKSKSLDGGLPTGGSLIQRIPLIGG